MRPVLANLFLVCAAVGGTVVVGQLIGGLLGLGHGHEHGGPGGHAGHDGPLLGDGHDGHGGHHGGHAHPSPWLSLLSVRALTAALALFGLAGLAGLHGGLGAGLAAALAGGAGLVGAALVASLEGALLRLRDDGTLRLRDAVGRSATVYLGIPGGREGAGKVTLCLQGRTVECEAITGQAGGLPTGSRVLVIDVLPSGRLAVEADPLPPGEDPDKD